MQCKQSQQEYAPVTVDMRALIDKVLARYSGEFTVFRELLQNSDDAGCGAAEIHFETAEFLSLKLGAATNAGPRKLPDLKTTNVAQWTFRNHGKPFTPQDWDRLPRIAMGNPDPRRVGAFGVGFYSLFSVTESPYVSSGGKEMGFSWRDENQLCYRFGNLPQTATEGLWTTFKMQLREESPMPPVSEFMQFLASSITFMVYLKDVTVFFDNQHVGQISKSQGQTQAIFIPPELERLSPEKIMSVKSVRQYRKSFQHMPITIKARILHPQHDSMHEMKLDLLVFTADVDVVVGEKLSGGLRRCMKKEPPSCLKYSLIYTGKDEYDQSHMGEQKHLREFSSPFRGLRADLDGATHTRLFIASLRGHATAQTTGMGGHMASHFIPTVERESIDLVDRNVAVWNKELLYVGGFLCRAVYEWELSGVQSSWEEAVTGKQLQDQRFLHLLKFFTFHHSTPSPKVAELLANSFYGCSTLPLRLLSSVGVRGAPDVRVFDLVFAKFLKSLPMLSEDVTRHYARSIARLPDQHKICSITLSDVLQYLRCHGLSVEELVACLRWWITGRNVSALNTTDLLAATTLYGTGGAIRLSSITHFINPQVLGRYIPPNGPLPLSLIPPGISKHFDCETLTNFGWKEFTVASWLQHISRPDVTSANEKYDLTRSVGWAIRVLNTICRIWLQLSEDMRSESREILRNKRCIPTSKGLYPPERSYLPIADNGLVRHLDLPMVSRDSGFEVDEDMRRFLLFIGVRKNLPIQSLLDLMLSTGDWTVFNLIDYLVQAEPSLTSEDISALKSSKIFRSESFQSIEEECTRHCSDELYPPMDIFRKFRLPVIEWNGKSEWRDKSPEALLLYRLGLNPFPPLPKIVELCSSSDVEVQKTAFEYLCSNLHSQYPHYKPGNFCDVEFIPAESKDRTGLKKLGEVYSGAQWKLLGLFVVQDRYLSAPLRQLGITQNPSTPKLLDLLETTPLPDEETAVHWFEALFDHMASFSPADLIKLSGLPIVPTGPSSTPRLLPPTKCYLDQGTIPILHAKLFEFVDFGTKANLFLGTCGLKNRVSIEDVAEAFIENPERFFELAGGYEGFLVELRKLAYQSLDISNYTLHKMSHKPTLLGTRRKKRDGKVGWDYEHRFLTYQGVTIVDDIDDYQLFSDCLFVAPREGVLERFYASLGCRYLSTIVKERCNDLHEMPATEICSDIQSLILERLPLFIQHYTDTKPKAEILSIPNHFKVKACKRILLSKTLVIGNVKRTKDVWATARREGECIELWISKTAKRDMYDLATSLFRLLFERNKMDATAHLERVLSADLEYLERRGFLIDRESQQFGDEYGVGNKARKQHSASPISTTSSPQQFVLDTDPQLNRERLSGGFEATPHFPSLSHATGGVLLKIHEASNVSSGKVLDTTGRPTSLPPSRTSREVIPQSYIRNNVEKAIEACSWGGEKSTIHARVNQFLGIGFCGVSGDVGCLRPIGQVKNIQICVDEGMPGADTFIERMCGPLTRFVDIIITLSEIYRISTKSLRVFYDISEGCIAFNYRGIIYLNLRYFEVWHDEQVESGNRQNARMSWFLALAHEIAHNLTELHDSDHEFWFSAICEAHLLAFSRLLQPANTWLRYVLRLGPMVVVILFACLAKHTSILLQ
ncbi:hypothetical protein EDC04DRAFT_3070659 [Pisolithus marmoratus]|nr:hypothetical protein EDC04DRAFT_3070659 [Pisolithus marmoratus]